MWSHESAVGWRCWKNIIGVLRAAFGMLYGAFNGGGKSLNAACALLLISPLFVRGWSRGPTQRWGALLATYSLAGIESSSGARGENNALYVSIYLYLIIPILILILILIIGYNTLIREVLRAVLRARLW